ncbi:MAG: hypothetical protein ABIR56_14430, partial [Polaromonas sp.]
ASAIKTAADLIKTNSDAAVENVKETTYQTQLACAAQFEVRLAGSIAKTLNDVAGAVATKAAMRWVLAGVVAAGFLTVFAGWTGYSQGKDAGNSMGYATARQEIAAAAWANTQEGRIAYQLAKAGSIEELARCNRPGWKVTDGWCYVSEAKDRKIYGWKVP